MERKESALWERGGRVNSQHQTDRDTSPETVQLPSKPKRGAKCQRERDDIVTHEVGIPAKLLLASTAQQAVANGRGAVEELHGGTDGHSSRDKTNDVLVGGEQKGELVPEHGQQSHVEETHEHAGIGGYLGAGLSRVYESGADEVGNARRGGDGDGEGDLECCRGDGHQDGLRCEVLGAELSRGKSQDLKGEPFGLDHDHSWDRQADHRT